MHIERGYVLAVLCMQNDQKQARTIVAIVVLYHNDLYSAAS